MSNDDTDDWSDYESGPFCAHWGGEDCDHPCGACGHRCHSFDDVCPTEGCGCEECTEETKDAKG